jgi:hypothetical protein
MAEYKLFEGDTPYVSTSEFHSHRPRAFHLEEDGHRERLYTAREFVGKAAEWDGGQVSVSDLGCGDGGLLSILQDMPEVSRCWGYDFQPSNAAGWQERGVTASLADAFGKDRDVIQYGRVVVTTEVLEHLADPHGAIEHFAYTSDYLVASSPYDEHADSHDECHAWAWDLEGYRNMVESNGFRVIEHRKLGWKFQVLLAVREWTRA